jgi:hypothetical protein
MENKKSQVGTRLALGIIGLGLIFIATIILMLMHCNELISYIDRKWWFKLMIILSVAFSAYLMIWLKKYKLNFYAKIEWLFGLTICYVSLSSLHDTKAFLTFFGGFFVVIRGTDNWFTDLQKKQNS